MLTVPEGQARATGGQAEAFIRWRRLPMAPVFESPRSPSLIYPFRGAEAPARLLADRHQTHFLPPLINSLKILPASTQRRLLVCRFPQPAAQNTLMSQVATRLSGATNCQMFLACTSQLDARLRALFLSAKGNRDNHHAITVAEKRSCLFICLFAQMTCGDAGLS